MATLLYTASMSLDGFIAGPGGDMSWLADPRYVGSDPDFDELPSRIGSLLIGARTWGGDDPNKGTENEGPFGGTWHGPQFVVTHSPPAEAVADTTFFTELPGAVAAARAAAGDSYVGILGADIARQCFELGEVDEVLVNVLPVLLGDGVRLYTVTGGRPISLEPTKMTPVNIWTNLWFRVVR